MVIETQASAVCCWFTHSFASLFRSCFIFIHFFFFSKKYIYSQRRLRTITTAHIHGWKFVEIAKACYWNEWFERVYRLVEFVVMLDVCIAGRTVYTHGYSVCVKACIKSTSRWVKLKTNIEWTTTTTKAAAAALHRELYWAKWRHLLCVRSRMLDTRKMFGIFSLSCVLLCFALFFFRHGFKE